ncbi:hypothetical protein ACWEKM_31360 [Streptomyces sp. NPDC004752]
MPQREISIGPGYVLDATDPAEGIGHLSRLLDEQQPLNVQGETM